MFDRGDLDNDPIIAMTPGAPPPDPMDAVRSEARLVSKLAHLCGRPTRDRLLRILAATGRLQAAVAVAAGVETPAKGDATRG